MRFLLALLLLASPAMAQFMNGVDANYVLEMEKAGKTWAGGDPYRTLAAAGANSFRVRLWTGDEGMNGLKYATETARRAQVAGLKPYLVIFLSDNWADFVKQPVPKIWKDLSYDDKVAAVEAYAERVTRHFKDAGVPIELFEIGNEIDFGICGEFEEEWPKRVSLDYMRQRIWPRMAPILAAAQRGVKTAQPQAKFILHLTQWDNTAYCTAFWKFMTDHGVSLDHPGLSYFPTNHPKPGQRSLAFLQQQLEAFHAATGKPLILCEYAFPSLAEFPGQFADWNKPIEGYPLDPAGQAKWLADFLAAARASKSLAGAFYWSPEWYASEADMWKAFALFDDQGKPKPALASLGKR
jgi:arabinogalactan endo-1,4-beta-galactosidase